MLSIITGWEKKTDVTGSSKKDNDEMKNEDKNEFIFQEYFRRWLKALSSSLDSSSLSSGSELFVELFSSSIFDTGNDWDLKLKDILNIKLL